METPYLPTKSPSPTPSLPDHLADMSDTVSRLVAGHSRHFLSLSIAFLLPISTLLIFLPFPFPYSLPPPQSLLFFFTASPSFSFPFAFAASTVFAIIFYLLAVGAITYSIHNAFFGRAVKLLPTLLSLAGALARLLATLAATAVPFAVLFSFAVFLILYFPHLALSYVLVGMIAVLAVFLCVEFCLAGVIAVIESTYGFAPLVRSWSLVTGMRWAVLLVLSFFVVCIGVVLWGFSISEMEMNASDWSGVIAVVVRAVLGSGILTVLMLYGLATNTVMYMHCKAMHGELVGEIYDEFVNTYVCLPFDERKEALIVSVVQSN